jgi:hypothetical protein
MNFTLYPPWILLIIHNLKKTKKCTVFSSIVQYLLHMFRFQTRHRYIRPNHYKTVITTLQDTLTFDNTRQLTGMSDHNRHIYIYIYIYIYHLTNDNEYEINTPMYSQSLVKSSLYIRNHCQQFLMKIFNFNDNLPLKSIFIRLIFHIFIL